jgi:histidyl-tRNA synthetase
MGDAARKEGLKLLDILRKDGIASDTDYEGRSLKGALRRANDLSARFALIIGDDEIKKDVITVKDMVSGEQKQINRGGLNGILKGSSQKG